MTDKRQLLCTFSNINDFKNVVEQIRRFYTMYNNPLFVFYNTQNAKELYITYNIINNNDLNFSKFPGTISIHRKRQTNTLYTLNAMNQIIRDENNGVVDKTFEINWDLYKDSLIITNDNLIRVISIKIYDIIN
jgi:hypothetical protein